MNDCGNFSSFAFNKVNAVRPATHYAVGLSLLRVCFCFRKAHDVIDKVALLVPMHSQHVATLSL